MERNRSSLCHIFFGLCFFTCMHAVTGQHSVARMWNEALLASIRGDFARPTVHARNLFHVSAAMYDAWAAYEEDARPYLLGNTVHGFSVPFDGVTLTTDKQDAQETAISYAAYRLLAYRFGNSPQAEKSQAYYDSLMNELGYDISVTSVNYQDSPAGLGNYIAEFIINYGLQDGSNEQNQYKNTYYGPVNDPLIPTQPGNPTMSDPNRWQPLSFENFIDQGGNVIGANTPAFLSPEWGRVLPFSLQESELNIYERDGDEYLVYHDPGSPPFLDDETTTTPGEYYKWGFSLVATWSSHLNADDLTEWDISPASIGNIDIKDIPSDFGDYPAFYDRINGGDIGEGWDVNPRTDQPYAPQYVKRGDYTRILAEFWADGPDSETPPGHWFTILNYVNDQPELVKKMGGEGDVLSDLEWDVKSYFMLGGAMHDVAIASWGIKGYYDYVRPISAIRYMADMGQSSDPGLPNYNPEGIPLEEGLIELVGGGDPLAVDQPENVGKIKLKAWRGHDYVADPTVDVAGVDWILAENWWPYQRPTFVTPPFAGFVSGHSTYSRAAAELLTLLTGDPFFPGGIGEFEAPKNEFLVFEEGPSEDVTLQWATYRDAADQCSLSRIWGGIHPPADDIPGRIIGEAIGVEAFYFATDYFKPPVTPLGTHKLAGEILLYPNPARQMMNIQHFGDLSQNLFLKINDLSGKVLLSREIHAGSGLLEIDISHLHSGIYLITLTDSNHQFTRQFIKE